MKLLKLLFDKLIFIWNSIRIYKEYIFIYTIPHLYYIILNINHVILYVSIILYIYIYFIIMSKKNINNELNYFVSSTSYFIILFYYLMLHHGENYVVNLWSMFQNTNV